VVDHSSARDDAEPVSKMPANSADPINTANSLFITYVTLLSYTVRVSKKKSRAWGPTLVFDIDVNWIVKGL
jgi:hypothetical protein